MVYLDTKMMASKRTQQLKNSDWSYKFTCLKCASNYVTTSRWNSVYCRDCEKDFKKEQVNREKFNDTVTHHLDTATDYVDKSFETWGGASYRESFSRLK